VALFRSFVSVAAGDYELMKKEDWMDKITR
jgi:hypothetical protein